MIHRLLPCLKRSPSREYCHVVHPTECKEAGTDIIDGKNAVCSVKGAVKNDVLVGLSTTQ